MRDLLGLPSTVVAHSEKNYTFGYQRNPRTLSPSTMGTFAGAHVNLAPTSTRVPQSSPRPGHSARALSVLVFDGLPPRE